MEKRDLKEFVQKIHNKISLVVAMVIIKLKPEYFTAEQYAEKVQDMVYSQWVKNSNTSIFEYKIIELQRGKLLKEINSLLLSPIQEDSKVLSTTNEIIPGVCSEQYLNNEHLFNESDSDSSDNDIFKNNISFIRAMVQLKFTVDSSKAIPTDIVHNFLNEIPRNEKLEYTSEKMLSYSQDSGFGEQNMQTVRNSVSSNIFRFITHSSLTEHLIKKCMTSVMRFACKSLLNTTIETFNSWQGSVMEYLCSVLQEISFHPLCSDCVLQFILKIVDDLWSSQDTNKHLVWEYQQHILSEFCVNSHICEIVIDSIMVKLNILADTINSFQIGSPEHLNNIHLFEKLPLFTQFVSTIIKKLRSYKAADFEQNKKVAKNNSAYTSVIHLWKLKWKECNESKCTKENLLIKWKDICEKLITLSATNFCMVSFYIWDIKMIIQEWIADLSI